MSWVGSRRKKKFAVNNGVKSIFQSQLCRTGGFNKDPTVWLDGARPPTFSFIGPALPENEFGKVIIQQTRPLRK